MVITIYLEYYQEPYILHLVCIYLRLQLFHQFTGIRVLTLYQYQYRVLFHLVVIDRKRQLTRDQTMSSSIFIQTSSLANSWRYLFETNVDTSIALIVRVVQILQHTYRSHTTILVPFQLHIQARKYFIGKPSILAIQELIW